MPRRADAAHFTKRFQSPGASARPETAGGWLRRASALAFALISLTAQAQDSVRMSAASAAAARARSQAATTVDYYNLQLGRSYWSFAARLGADYDSNVTLTANHPEYDFIFRPELDVKMLLPVSDKNSLNLSAGAGYSAYVMHSQLRRVYVTPDTAVSFDVYAGDFWINLHDRVSISENSYQDPTVTGSGNFSQLQNAAGLGATWDLNKVILKLGYDHVTYSTLSGNNGGQTGGSSEVMSLSAGCLVAPGWRLGVELGGDRLHYDTSTTNAPYTDAWQWSVGAFCDAQPGEYLHVRANAGYTRYLPEFKSSAAGAGDFSGIYAQLELQHRLNQYVDYTLTAGRSLNFAFFGGTVDLYFARWDARWKIFRKTSVSTSFDFEHGKQLGAGAETFSRYGPAFSLSRPITEKLSGSVGYHYYWRESSLAGRGYTSSIVTSDLSYRF